MHVYSHMNSIEHYNMVVLYTARTNQHPQPLLVSEIGQVSGVGGVQNSDRIIN